jgi:glycosyltransferase involved in cell wall biosynthesis
MVLADCHQYCPFSRRRCRRAWRKSARCATSSRRKSEISPVEHLTLIDNKRRTVGEKRDALLRAARGKYVAFVDDDDSVSDDYVSQLLTAAGGDPDVITFRQRSIINGAEGEIVFGLGNPNESFVAGGSAKRNAWHVCAWRRVLAILSHFPASNYGEDWAYAAPLCGIPNLRSAHVDAVLHTYIHDARTTEAPPPD